jgi:hypothetical protein
VSRASPAPGAPPKPRAQHNQDLEGEVDRIAGPLPPSARGTPWRERWRRLGEHQGNAVRARVDQGLRKVWKGPARARIARAGAPGIGRRGRRKAADERAGEALLVRAYAVSVTAAFTSSALSRSTCSLVTLVAFDRAASTSSAQRLSKTATMPELLMGSTSSISALISLR